MKKEVTHNIIILVVLLAAVAIIFANASFNFTGHVIVEGDWNETSCDAEEYFWYADNCYDIEPVCGTDFLELCTDETNCTSVEGFWYDANDDGTLTCNEEEQSVCDSDHLDICDETSCEAEEYFWYADNCYDIEPVCGTDFLELCTDETNCTSVEGFWYADNCYDIEPVCGTDFLELCTDETTCTDADGYWYANICNANAQCTIRTCSSLNYECGSTSDGCDGTLDCGDCGSGYSCNSDHVCEADETTDDSDTSSSSTESESFSSSDMISSKKCVPAWQCTDWSECINETQTRTCTDSKNCKTEEGKPEISQSCTIPETCFDKIRNQNEQGIDCGGVCEKKCSIFTIIGSAITGPAESGKNFFVENKTATFIVLGVLVLLGGGVVGLMFFLKKSHKKLTDLLPHNLISVFMKKGLISND